MCFAAAVNVPGPFPAVGEANILRAMTAMAKTGVILLLIMVVLENERAQVTVLLPSLWPCFLLTCL